MATSASVDTLYQSDGVVIANKPAGLPSTGRDLEDPDCLQYRLMQHLGRKVWAVHQLDRDTSGVNLFVWKKSLAPLWQDRLGAEGSHKVYLAICHGSPSFDRLEVDAPIAGSRFHGEWWWRVHSDGRPARSSLQVLDRVAGYAWVAVSIHTGRTHQVRIHLAHVGHPLVGEPRYCDPPCREHPRHALHATWLRIECGSEKPLEVTAPLPADLIELARRLGLRDDIDSRAPWSEQRWLSRP
jgi:23S rRNA-/tRNA-specific pseudouridylate synthase